MNSVFRFPRFPIIRGIRLRLSTDDERLLELVLVVFESSRDLAGSSSELSIGSSSKPISMKPNDIAS